MIGNISNKNAPEKKWADSIPKKHSRSIIKSLLYLISIDQLAMTLTFPLITLIFFDTHSRLFPEDTSFATRSLWYGIVNAIPNVLNIFFSPLLSALSDVFGRKKIMLFEVASGCLFGLLLGFGIYMGNLIFVLIAFAVRGAFAKTNPTALAIIGDIATKDNKIILMGYLQFAISIGATLGPIIGGYIAARFFFTTLNYSFAFFVVAIIAVLNTFLGLKLLKETLRQAVPIRLIYWHALKQTIFHQEVLRISCILLLIQLAWSTYYQFMPAILKTHFYFDNDRLGIFIGMIALWLALASSIVLKWLQYFCNAQQLLTIAIYFILFGLLITIIALTYVNDNHTTLFWLSAAPIAIGDILSYICLTACYSNAVPHEAQGSVMGFSFIVTRIAWATTSVLGGYLISYSPQLLFTLSLSCIIAVLILIQHPLGRLTQAADSVEH